MQTYNNSPLDDFIFFDESLHSLADEREACTKNCSECPKLEKEKLGPEIEK